MRTLFERVQKWRAIVADADQARRPSRPPERKRRARARPKPRRSNAASGDRSYLGQRRGAAERVLSTPSSILSPALASLRFCAEAASHHTARCSTPPTRAAQPHPLRVLSCKVRTTHHLHGCGLSNQCWLRMAKSDRFTVPSPLRSPVLDGHAGPGQPASRANNHQAA